MSLMGTLAKVAVGVAVAKGASSLMRSASNSGNSNSLFGALGGGQQGASQGGMTGRGGMTGMVSQLLSGQGGAQSQPGLGGLLESLSGGQAGQGAGGMGGGGGLNNILGGLAGQFGGAGGLAAGAGAGGLAALIGGIAAKAGGQGAGAGGGAGFGDALNQAITRQGEPEQAPNADQEAVAGLMLAAMIQAAKSDGEIDKEETERFLKHLGEIDQEELAFVQQCMQAPVDINALVRQTPPGLEAQLYTVSILAITPDNENEIKYLRDLASALKLNAATVNDIHDRVGAPKIF